MSLKKLHQVAFQANMFRWCTSCCAWLVRFRHVGYHKESFIYREDGIRKGLGVCSYHACESSLPLTSPGAVLWPDLYLLTCRRGTSAFQVHCVLQVVAYLTCSGNEQPWSDLHHMATSYGLLRVLIEKYEGGQQCLFRHDCIRPQKTYKEKTAPAICRFF